MIYRGLAITGSGTGVGKTTVACALARLLREKGMRVGALKPVETGCEGGDLRPLDALALAAAAGLKVRSGVSPSLSFPGADPAIAIDHIVPWRFGPPLAPEEAARLAGIEIAVDRIYQAMDRWMEDSDLVLVETAGGLMVPLNPRFTFADLLQGLELPVLVAAPNQLGVINHVLLTLEALERRDLTAIAVALFSLDRGPDPSMESNAEVIRRHAGVPVHEIPFAPDAPVQAAIEALRPALAGMIAAMEAEWRRILLRYVNRADAGNEGGTK